MQTSVSSTSSLIGLAKHFNSGQSFLILNEVRVEIYLGTRQTAATAKQGSFAGANFMGFICLNFVKIDWRQVLETSKYL